MTRARQAVQAPLKPKHARLPGTPSLQRQPPRSSPVSCSSTAGRPAAQPVVQRRGLLLSVVAGGWLSVVRGSAGDEVGVQVRMLQVGRMRASSLPHHACMVPWW